jgi:radical SAM protein with 4Fe4S-binding SPASM domain
MAGRQAAELTAEESIAIVDDIAMEFGKALLVFSGGEPLMRRDIFDLLTRAKCAGLRTALATNGKLLCKDDVARLKASGVGRVSISLDSSDEISHDNARGAKGSFKASIAGASMLKDAAVPFQINFTVTGKNADEIQPIAKFAATLGATAVHYFVLVPVGCGRELTDGEALGAEDVERALIAIRDVAGAMPYIEVRPTCAPQYKRIAPDFKGGGCMAGTGAFFISAEGDIYPCGYLPVKAGSLREGSVGSIWRGSEVFRVLRRNELGGGCAECESKDACRGCRARAYSATGDMMSGDPSCAHRKISQCEIEKYYCSSEAKNYNSRPCSNNNFWPSREP